ncbi:MAG: flagellar hook-associated protein FlgK [Oceanospirillales bacterium]|nr:flagellar hook-associated protein FlgK [Oceanospirillales bacterium]MBR9887158.1 flagellar hook-associated protein FlgK [Oceanospirillales bacterium]
MSSFSLLNIGIQAAQANQTALSTIGQNISNVNTEGYSRQRVDLVSRPDLSGVFVNDIERISDKFLTQQMWSDLSSYNQTSAYAELSGRLDNLLATSSQSVSSALDDYFGALQNAVDDPVSIPNRELFIAQADALVKRFNNLDANIRTQDETINQQLDGYASQITTLAANIANINDNIRVATASNNSANDLRDHRDELVNQLSSLVGVTVVDQGEEYSIFIGNGQPLVVGSTAEKVISVQGNPDGSQHELALVIANETINVNDEIVGGKIGGLLQYREQTLGDARNELGLIAIGFAESMNQQHEAGIDLNNEFGGELFTNMNSDYLQQKRIASNNNNISVVQTARVEIQQTELLQASDYELVVGDNNQFTLFRKSDGKQIAINQFSAVTDPTPLTPLSPDDRNAAIESVGQNEFFIDPSGRSISFGVDGIKVTIETTGRLAKGDRFLIQPVKSGAQDLSLTLHDGRQLALASPIRVTENNDNQGTGVATATVTDPGAGSFAIPGQLTPPIEIVFNAPAPTLPGDPASPMTYTLYDMTDPTNPVPWVNEQGVTQSNQPFVSGGDIQLDGYTVSIDNLPSPGDRFSFGFNLDGVSDNRNALALSNLQQSNLFDRGSYQDLYGSLVEAVGTRTATANISEQANKAVLDTTAGAKASVSGVNLDEEAAKLVQFQQAYQASAQLIRVSQTIFDSLLNSV